MAEQLKQERSTKKRLLTRAINDIQRCVTEEDSDEVTARLAVLKAKFRDFETAHDNYHCTLVDEDELDTSDQYYYDVQNGYVATVKNCKDWLKAVTNVLQGNGDDDNVSVSSSSTSELSTAEIISVMNMPKVELESYNGDPMRFHAFFAIFDEMVDKTASDDSAKLTRLLQYTSGLAKEAIRSCSLIGAEGYKQARDILHKRFGDDHIICEKLMQTMKKGAPIKTSADLRRFADELVNSYSTLCNMKRIHEIDTQSSITEIAGRLQPYLRQRWKKQALQVKKEADTYPGFKALVEFVNQAADESSDPVYGQWNVKPTFSAEHKPKSKQTGSTSSTSFSTDSRFPTSYKKPCVLCNQDHRLFGCPVFKSMKPSDRLRLVQEKKLCENCLLSNHNTSSCRKTSVCSVPGCGRRHTKFIHVDTAPATRQITSSSSADQATYPSQVSTASPPVSEITTRVSQVMTNASLNVKNNVCVPVVPVTVNNIYQTMALLDTGSTSTFCTRKMVDRLGVKGNIISYSLNTLSQMNEKKNTEIVSLTVKPRDGDDLLLLSNVHVVDAIPVGNPVLNVRKYPHLADLDLGASIGEVDVLVGQDHAEALIPLEIRKGVKGDPFAVRTILGWSVNGPLRYNSIVRREVISNFVTTQVHEDLHRIWEIEQDSISKTSLSVEDQKVIELWDKEVKFENSHYTLPIPWKNDICVPDNISLAISRLNSLKTSLMKRELYDRYDAEITKLLDKGYAEPVPIFDVKLNDGQWYLPHQAVLSDKKPDKLRVVYDCAAKYLGESLNDKCLQGPDLNVRLFNVLLRFRNHQYAFTADIEAMYYQVRVPVKDRNFLRFLWFAKDGSLEHFRMNAHVFGGVWCSSAAAYAVRKAVDDFCDIELVRDVITNSFYVDDCLCSLADLDEAIMAIEGVKRVLGKGGFNVTKYVVNNDQLLTAVPEMDRTLDRKKLQSNSHSKVLGLTWNVSDDSIVFDVNVPTAEHITKRVILSSVSSLFDPLGLITPVLIPGRILFQDAVREKLEWDDQVNSETVNQWQNWIKSVERLKTISVSRCVKPVNFNEAYLELHHFCDASEKAYGCCSYLRAINSSGMIHTALLCSKGKVAPVKSQTIPRLELQAAVLAARMDAILIDELQLQLGKSHFWTDSEIVLKYLKNEHLRFHVFVSNRVGEIRRLSDPSQWNHIAGVINPADIITRGIDTSELMSSVWFRGPDFLRTFKCDWKLESCDLEIENDPEVKSQVNTSCVTDATLHPVDILMNHYSSWYRLKRAVGWWLKFVDYLKHRKAASKLSVSDVKAAEVLIIKHSQSQSYSKEIERLAVNKPIHRDSSIRDLSPILDTEGVLRVGGRIRNGPLSYDSTHPVIVSHKSPIAILIVTEFHSIAHAGTEWTLSSIRRRYWITRVRSIAKGTKRNCITCRKLKGQPCVQRMADLPTERLNPGKPPFAFVGTDCFGPIVVKYGRSEVKRYVCLFTCFTTRAVHLELLHNMDTDAFINALRRFMSRRGYPEKIWSDNGTNFVGGKRELEKSVKEIDNDRVHNHCLKLNVEWVFNPPSAPHMGGVFERMVQTVKRVLSAVLCKARLNDETLSTVLCEVENIVNSRPITKVSADCTDPVALTPNSMLILQCGPAPVMGRFEEADLYRKRWRQVQYVADCFWSRWTKEYLPLLQKVNKWHNVQVNLKVNDLVLVVDECTPRGLWPMGIVTQVKTSKDGLVRTVHVRTKSTVLVRPISKIVLLEGH